MTRAAAQPLRAPAGKVRLARRGGARRNCSIIPFPGRQHRGLRYNLQYGLPMTNPQLASAWRRELNHAAAHAEMDYPDPQGIDELRRQVCDYLARRRGILAAPEDVLIVSGTQQALALAADVLLDEGDRVLLEDPHYRGARQLLQARGADVRGCRVDSEGLVTQELPQDKNTRVAVVTPSHQFPTGAVLSLTRRMQLLAWAERKGCWLIEDDYDGEFRYDARPLAALKSLDRCRDASSTSVRFPKCCSPRCAWATWFCRRDCVTRLLRPNGSPTADVRRSSRPPWPVLSAAVPSSAICARRRRI